jgi:dolichol-phosphate hexosyltransferase
MRASLIVPTLNEAASIGHVLQTFQAAAAAANTTRFARDPVEWEVIVVDGNSTDGTPEIARRHGARVIAEPRKGYGRAYRTGFACANGEFLATLDGDATYPAEEVPRLLQHLIDQRLDFLSTNRLVALDPRAMSHEHRIGNWVLNWALAIAYRRYFRRTGPVLRDSQSGMWVFRRELLGRLSLTQDGMSMSEELKIEVVVSGARYDELPIHYAERWGAPKLSSWQDGFGNLRFLVTHRLKLHREAREPPNPPVAQSPEISGR